MVMTQHELLSDTSFPLTKQQEGLWVEWKMHPDNSSYNTCVNLRLKGELDEVRFEQALHDVVRFFTSLRIYFAEHSGVPRQHISDDVTFHLEKEDISSPDIRRETPELAAYGRKFLARKVATPIDLTVFPIVHAGLLKVTHDTYYFIGMVPHMISDGVSAVLFLESTSIAYNKGYQGLIDAYGANEKSWEDYFLRHAHHDAAKTAEAALYWKERLNGAQHTVDFDPASRNALASKKGKRVYFDLDAELSTRLKHLSRQNRTTFFSVLNAAFATLINRLYRQDDMTIGYPVNIRPAGYKTFFGFFVNIIPLRIDSSGNPTFAELIERIASGRKADKQYQHFPALDIVRQIRKTNSEFDGRVFNISMAQTVSRLVNLNLDGMVSEPLEVTYNDVNDDLSLSYEILDDGRIGLWFEYRESLFEVSEIQRMIDYTQRIFKQVVENSDIRISELTLCDVPAISHHAPDLSHRPDTLTRWLEIAAHLYADKTALIGECEITYLQLHQNANRLAHYLLSKNVKTGDRLAIHLPRGAMQLQTLLACLKIGAAYVPCSTDYPQARINNIIRQAECRLILTQSAISTEGQCQTVNLSEVLFDDQPADAPDCVITGEDLAYIIFTSGSTGVPKGVAIQHKHLIARLDWMHHQFPLNTSDRTLQNTDITFDVSVAEIFWTLTSGAALVLTDADTYKDAGYLLERIRNTRVSACCMVPSLLGSLLALNKYTPLTSLKYMLSAGEALPASVVSQYYQQCSGTLWNIYGPTEATIYACAYQCKEKIYDTVPIGRAIAHTELTVINQYNQPVSNGIIGELCISGAGIADGYWNNQPLSTRAFIPHPQDASKQLYKTGDLVRRNASGEIDYFGRIDAQVKIRGYRIELGEIAAVAKQMDRITDAAVIDYRHDASSHARLVLYYCSESSVDIDRLQTHLKAHLPDYMIPQFYVPVDAIPRMSSSKINRRALPAPELPSSKRPFEAPNNEREIALSHIWSRILHIPQERISRHDNFFELGGDSLLAIQCACEAEKDGLYFSTSSMFHHTSIAALAENAESEKTQHVVVSQDRLSGIYPLLPRQHKFFVDGFTHPHHWNHHFHFNVDHHAEEAHLKAAFDTVLLQHDGMRASFKLGDTKEWEQHIADTLPEKDYLFCYDIHHLSADAQQDVVCDTINQHHAAMQLGDAPLCRLCYFRTGENAGVLAIIAHHLLLDMMSARILFEDFLTFYEAVRHNIPFPLQNKTSSIADVSHFYDALSHKDDAYQKVVSYWNNKNFEQKNELSIIKNRTALEKTSKRAGIVINEALTAQLLTQKNSTIQDVALAAIIKTLSSHTQQNTLLINLCGHGRQERAGIDNTRSVGWMNSVFPVAANYKHDRSLQENATEFQTMRNAVPEHNDIYQYLRFQRAISEFQKHETPNIFFNYISQLDALLPEVLSITPVPPPEGICSSHPDNHLCYALYFEAAIIQKKLHIYCSYSTDIIEESNMSIITENIEKELNALA